MVVILKWIDFIEYFVIIVFVCEGMFYWWKGSMSVKKFGFNYFYEGMELLV